jgi:Tfp pilus assembly protein PilO
MFKKIVSFLKKKKVLLVILLITLLYCCGCSKFFMKSMKEMKEEKKQIKEKKLAKIQQRMQVDLLQTIHTDIDELSQAPQVMPSADEIVKMYE